MKRKSQCKKERLMIILEKVFNIKRMIVCVGAVCIMTLMAISVLFMLQILNTIPGLHSAISGIAGHLSEMYPVVMSFTVVGIFLSVIVGCIDARELKRC